MTRWGIWGVVLIGGAVFMLFAIRGATEPLGEWSSIVRLLTLFFFGLLWGRILYFWWEDKPR